MTESVIPPQVDYYALVDQAMTKYPFDPRRAEQLMIEAGFRRAADTYYAGPEGRLSWEVRVNAGAQAEAEMAVMGSVWRQHGFDFAENALRTATRDPETRYIYPTLFSGGGGVGEAALAAFVSTSIPGPNNRWIGTNRMGYVNTEYDRLVETFNNTLDRAERGRVVAQLVRIFTEDVPAISLFHNPGILAHVAALRGPVESAPDAARSWNIHEWEWTG